MTPPLTNKLLDKLVGVNNTVFKELVTEFENANPDIRGDVTWNTFLIRECALRSLNG